MSTSTNTSHRRISVIAAEIERNWNKPSIYAEPYLRAMKSLETIDDADEAKAIVGYFLVAATSWRGTEARRIKIELRAMLAGGTRPCLR